VATIIVEADGAAHRSLKAPNIDYEPVIPANSSLVIPVIGIDVLGCDMREEYVFRSDIASRLTGLATGDIITPKAIAILITHLEGVAWNSPDNARIIPFVNKVDMDRLLPMARVVVVALEIIKMSHNRIRRVVLGHAKLFPPVAEVILR
jgi:probable selenium-dependent hydroxylase accessory protein YqeC